MDQGDVFVRFIHEFRMRDHLADSDSCPVRCIQLNSSDQYLQPARLGDLPGILVLNAMCGGKHPLRMNQRSSTPIRPIRIRSIGILQYGDMIRILPWRDNSPSNYVG